MSKTKPSLTERFVLRLPLDLRGRVAEKARRNHRSINSEILHTLDSSFDTPGEVGMNLPREISPTERKLRGIIHTLGVAQQEALIALLQTDPAEGSDSTGKSQKA